MNLNILHRPVRGPLYSVYRRQQDLTHGFGFKTTIFLQYGDLFNEATVAEALADASGFGDEIALGFHDLSGPGLDQYVKGLNRIWLLSQERKQRIIKTIVAKFQETFDRAPTAAGSYHFDAGALRILKQCAPAVESVVGGCFEEGVRVFHGCNNSWYLFNEGMPWNPWYPSRTHTLRPARDEADWAGVVAVPHLMRDMSLAYEGRNDFWASHPPNVIRGLGNDGSNSPYDLNLIDQFRMQAKWNGYAYYNTFVSVPWLVWGKCTDCAPEIAWELYSKFLAYLAELKMRNEVVDMTLTEYGRWHREHRPIGSAEIYWAREMLYGSRKHYFWFADPHCRVLIDTAQGGSIGDLRPYSGQVAVSTGPDGPDREIGSYPFLIQSQYRTGAATHSADGSRTTLLIRHGEETIDLCRIRTRVAKVGITSDAEIPYGSRRACHAVTLTPARFRFSNGLTGEIVTRYAFFPEGRIRIERRLMNLSDANTELILTEYCKAAPGRTEYPEPMHDIRLLLDGTQPRDMAFDYSGEEFESAGATTASAFVTQVGTLMELAAESAASSGTVRIGHLFSPFFTLSLNYHTKGPAQIITWIHLKNINT